MTLITIVMLLCGLAAAQPVKVLPKQLRTPAEHAQHFFTGFRLTDTSGSYEYHDSLILGDATVASKTFSRWVYTPEQSPWRDDTAVTRRFCIADSAEPCDYLLFDDSVDSALVTVCEDSPYISGRVALGYRPSVAVVDSVAARLFATPKPVSFFAYEGFESVLSTDTLRFLRHNRIWWYEDLEAKIDDEGVAFIIIKLHPHLRPTVPSDQWIWGETKRMLEGTPHH